MNGDSTFAPLIRKVVPCWLYLDCGREKNHISEDVVPLMRRAKRFTENSEYVYIEAVGSLGDLRQVTVLRT